MTKAEISDRIEGLRAKPRDRTWLESIAIVLRAYCQTGTEWHDIADRLAGMRVHLEDIPERDAIVRLLRRL